MFDYHPHSTLSDGNNTPDEMILSAIEKGFSKIGFSEHSFADFDPFGAIKPDKFEEYKTTINGLKEKYSDRIRIFCGLEQDLYTPLPAGTPDYIIGSMHYVLENGQYICVDDKLEYVLNAIHNVYHDDAYAFAETYFQQIQSLIEITNADIIGHFDLITRFNSELNFLDTKHPCYVNAWKKAADTLLKYKKAFEINTSRMVKKLSNEPYPFFEILNYVVQNVGKLVLSSDSHRAANIGKYFDEMTQIYHEYLIDPLQDDSIEI